MNGICRDNHFVAQMYLEPWKNKNNMIWTYDLLVPHEKCYVWNEKSIKSIACQRDFYTRVNGKDELDDIEKFFNSEFETPASVPLKKAINGEDLSSDDWEKLINYIGAQIVRTPAFVSRVFDNKKKFKEAFEQGIYTIERKLNTLSIEEIKNYSKKGKADLYNYLFPLKIVNTGINCGENKSLIKIETILGKSYFLYLMLYLLIYSIKVLHKHNWKIINLDDRVKIPTSDNPAICLNYYSPNNYDFGGGWDNKGSEIIFPISPNRVIYTKIGEKDSYFNPDYETSMIIKQIIIEHAYRKIFSIEKEKWITKKRKRYVNREVYEKEKESLNNWHENYKKFETEFLEHKIIEEIKFI